MQVNYLDIMLFVLFFQLISLTPYLVFSGRKNIPDKILALFLFAKALCISNFLSFRMADAFLDNFPHLFYFGSSFTILWGPVLYFYIKSLTYKDFQFIRHDFLHLLPFIIHFVYLFFSFHIYGADTKREILFGGGVFSQEVAMAITISVQVLILIYTIAALRLLGKYRSTIKENFSSIDSINLRWIYFVLAGFLLKWIFDIWFMTETFLTGSEAELPLILSRVVLFLFINMMIYKGLKQPDIFSGIEKEESKKRLSLSETIHEKYVRQLKEHMENEKSYLDPEITLTELSKKVGIPQRSLSEVINNGFGKNFYDFINSLRISESQQLLKRRSVPKTTVLEVLYQSGFNSKSSFNNAFKKHTGMTPSEFQKLHQN